MALTKNYIADPVEAVQVTYDNAEEVVEWCGGTLISKSITDAGVEKVRIHIKKLHGGANPLPAHVGYWVLKESSGKFRVFTDKAFSNIFKEVTK